MTELIDLTTATTSDPTERCALWRQRTFEAVAGMTRFIAERGGERIDDWFTLQTDLFAEVPHSSDEPERWQRTFFRAQALLERFALGHFGEAGLTAWALANAQIYRDVEPDHHGGPADLASRLARQAALYGSRYEITEARPSSAEVAIRHCSIWDYRERARARQVPITLESPCHWCTQSFAANARAKGQEATVELVEGSDGRGCRWTFTAGST
jgi:hypothetical protein